MGHLYYYASVLLLAAATINLPPVSSVLVYQSEPFSNTTAAPTSGPMKRECPTGRSRTLTRALVVRALQLGAARSPHDIGALGRGRRRARGIRVLDLSGCPFRHIARDAFAPLARATLYSYDRSNSNSNANASGAPPAANASATNRAALAVRIIDLSGSRLERLAPGAFRDLPHVRSIRLRHSQQLQFIADGAFARLPALRVLDVSHSPRLEYLSPEAFRRTPRLRLLVLRNCSSLIGLQVPAFFYHIAPPPSLSNLKVAGISNSSGKWSARSLVTVDLRSSSRLLCKCELLDLFSSSRVLLNERSQCTLDSSSPQRRLKLKELRAGRATECDCTPHAVIFPLGHIHTSRPAAAAAATPNGGRPQDSNPNPTLTLSARAGRRVALACRSLEAQNTSLQWSWRSLDPRSSVSKQVASRHNSGVLVLRFAQLRPQQAGFFTCTATSNCGTHSSTVRLIVRRALRIGGTSRKPRVQLFQLQ